MKVIIAGSRTVIDGPQIYERITDALIDLEKFTGCAVAQIVSGGASGADKIGENYARRLGIDLKTFPANWVKFGKRAGYYRNSRMAEYANALIAFQEWNSRGTQHMIDLARRAEMPMVVFQREGRQTLRSYKFVASCI